MSRIARTAAVLVAATVAIVHVGTTERARADTVIPLPPIPIIVSPTDPAAPGTTPITISIDGEGAIFVDNPGNAVPVPQQCPVIDGMTYCVGTPDQLASGVGSPLVVSGSIPPSGVFDGLPNNTYGWIIDEGVDLIAGMHGIRDVSTVNRFARPALRAYMLARLIDIIDKKIYDEPMTAEETQAYDALMQEFTAREVAKAKAVLAEFERWEANSCTYPVPNPPAPGLPFLSNPVAATAVCKKSFNPFVDASGFVKNTPPVATFEQWAAYRNPSVLAAQANNPAFREMTSSTFAAIGFMASLAAAAIAGAVTYTVLAATLSYAAGKAVLLALTLAGGKIVAAIKTGTVIVSAAASVAAIVAVVILALAATGVSIWTIVREEQIGQTIKRRAQEAAQNNDPLGIAAAITAYSGLDYATRQKPATPALPHTEAFTSQLLGMVNEWTMVGSDGAFLPDPTTGIGSSGPGPLDPRFVVNGIVRDQVAVLAPNGTIDGAGNAISGYRVHVNDGWLMVSEFRNNAYQAPEPRLSVTYVEPDGTPGQMSIVRAVDDDDELARVFALTTADQDDVSVTDFSTTWDFRGPGGATQDVTLQVRPIVTAPVSLLPTAVGTLRPGGTVTFQSNVSAPGATATGTYSWVIERLGPNGTAVQTWTQGNLTGFQQQFATPGQYRAKVRYQGTRQGTPFDVSGTVSFEVIAPAPELFSATLGEPRLRDDLVLNGSLSLDLRILQDVPSSASNPDVLDVEVEWASTASGTPIVQNYTVRCVPVGDGTCETGALVSPAGAPLNPQWSASPTYRIPDDQAFLPYVTVTITDRYDNVVTRVFRMPGEHRPRFVDPNPFVEMPMGTFSRVRVTEVVPSALLPAPTNPAVDAITLVPYLNQLTSRLPEGVQAEVIREGDRYFIEFFGEPHTLGPRTFALPADQWPVGAGWKATPALVTLSVVSSLTPGYRAVLRGVPQFVDRFYRTDWPQWYVQVPVRSDLPTDPPFTGTVRCQLLRFGQPIVDEVCEQDALFPWPSGLQNGFYQASVIAESTTQTVVGPAYSIGFNASFVQPTVSLDSVTPTATTQRVRLSVVDNDFPGGDVPVPFSASDYTVTCQLDGAAAVPCLDNGVYDAPRRLGDQELVVAVTTPDGAVSRRTVSWRVGATRPTAPGRPTAVRGDGSVRVSWPAASSAFGAVTGYTATASPGGRTCTTTGSRSCTITGLRNGVEHTVVVRARTSAGFGPSSVRSRPATPATVPGSPRRVTTVSPRARVLVVEWSAPQSNGGSAITSYAVSHRTTGTTKWSRWQTVTSGRRAVLTGLISGARYDVRVIARNAIGGSRVPAQVRTGPVR